MLMGRSKQEVQIESGWLNVENDCASKEKDHFYFV